MSKLLTLIGGAFSPANISHLALWLDAADSSTIEKNPSDLVSSWNDKSGNNNHATQATENNKPTWQASGLNNLPTLHFANNFLQISNNSTLDYSDLSIFIVSAATVDNGSVHYIMWKWGATGNREFIIQHDFLNDDIRFNSSSDGTAVDGSIIGGTLNLGTAQIIELHNDGGTTTGCEILIDGSSVGTDSTPGSIFNSSDSLKIGHNATGGEKTISEILVYTQTLNAAERAEVRQYLTEKWSI